MKQYLVGKKQGREEGRRLTQPRGRMTRPMWSDYLLHLDQGALGVYTGVIYIN